MHPHIASLRRFAFAFSRDWSEADDLAQEALIKAFRSISGFRGDSGLATWLYAIARTTFIDSRRGRQARARASEQELTTEPPDNSAGVEEALSARREARRLWKAIEALEPRFRVPLVLFEIEGMSYDEIATIEEVPVGTIRSRLNRARARLLELLGALHDEPPVQRAVGTSGGAAASNLRRRTNP